MRKHLEIKNFPGGSLSANFISPTHRATSAMLDHCLRRRPNITLASGQHDACVCRMVVRDITMSHLSHLGLQYSQDGRQQQHHRCKLSLVSNSIVLDYFHEGCVDSEQFTCHTTTKNPYICNQNTKIHHNICCADQETCIKINVDRYHAGHQLEKTKNNNKDHRAIHEDASAPYGELMHRI